MPQFKLIHLGEHRRFCLQSNFYEDEIECAIDPDDILCFDSGDESDDSIPIISIETFTAPLYIPIID